MISLVCMCIAAFAMASSDCVGEECQTKGASLLQSKQKLAKVSAQGKGDLSLEADVEEDLGEFTEEEIIDDNILEDEGNCPPYCAWTKVTKNPWPLKCWTWACQGCQEWKGNCTNVTKPVDESTLCIPKCGRFLKWADRSRRNPKAMRCSTVKCQFCDGSEHKCKKKE